MSDDLIVMDAAGVAYAHLAAAGLVYLLVALLTCWLAFRG